MDKLGIVEVVAAALRTRATTSGTRRSPRTRWPCEASKVPTFFDGAYMVYFVEEAPAAEEERRWGWTRWAARVDAWKFLNCFDFLDLFCKICVGIFL